MISKIQRLCCAVLLLLIAVVVLRLEIKGYTQIEGQSHRVQISNALCISMTCVNKILIIINKFLFELYVVIV